MPLKSQTWTELKLLLQELSPKRLRYLALVLLASLFQGIIDILLVGLLARLVGLLAGAKLGDQIPGIRFFGGGLLDQAGWIVALLIAAYWLASGIRFGVALLESLLTAEIWSDLVNKVYRNLMLQRYEFFMHKRTSVLSERFNRILSRVTGAVITPMIAIAGSLLSVMALIMGVVFVLGGSSILIFSLLLLAYAISSKIITPYLRLAVRQKNRYTRRLHIIFSESIRSMRDVQLYSSHEFFVDRFSRDGVLAKRNDRLSTLLPNVPRFLIEPAGITILFAVGLAPAMIAGDGSRLREALPELATILVVLLRISGPLQSVFRSINKLRGGLPEVKDALELLRMRPERLSLGDPGVPSPEGVMARRLIELHDVSFSYQGSSTPVLEGINLSIPVGSRIALVGKTGSGKTTMAHLLLGLYTPTLGELLLDGVPVSDEEMPAWQANCAFVPQLIRLLDASVRENVAFCEDPDLIDDDQVWAALEAAQFAEFVSQMPYGLFTMCGENGMKLSGGQRQRLSLARAFYRRAKLMVLDEATSALDNKTEHDVMQALDLVGRRCTMVVIAHRLSTVKKCDRIYEVDRGRIIASGDFQRLTEISPSFRERTMLDAV
ncbi:ABC transporter ATP-binding protein [Synechococcus sp. HK01-R]|uniref:ABC transporter ATP-binding protein n=1 Tax=Synechococcus sp. HK01-R TaxID=2751171 RepID=UPI00162331C5|nr:ABC transporter ATP-binding protein [Synechococcus sp. HK01-R]QNG27928.1 ABC transporter ATP-binding protein [Synechococcus sp. HK01-R]